MAEASWAAGSRRDGLERWPRGTATTESDKSPPGSSLSQHAAKGRRHSPKDDHGLTVNTVPITTGTTHAGAS